MLKYLKIYIFLIFYFSNNILYASTKKVQIKLSEETVNTFYNYISSNRKALDKFLITEDGTGTFVWVCPQTLCFPAGENFYLKPCSKLNENKPCKIFALKRKIKLTNSDKIPNDLKKFKSGDSFEEVRNKLKKLGFVD